MDWVSLLRDRLGIAAGEEWRGARVERVVVDPQAGAWDIHLELAQPVRRADIERLQQELAARVESLRAVRLLVRLADPARALGYILQQRKDELSSSFFSPPLRER
ncbi:MAG: PolC-type DNA polymerase III N-terminal domain-containing protein, partial [Syntrophomonadaceae bacterium]|nr:PolC-type DNA polymerase III N-terminal domain-containing protein [Syntrophomonadaceae bacterium]